MDDSKILDSKNDKSGRLQMDESKKHEQEVKKTADSKKGKLRS